MLGAVSFEWRGLGDEIVKVLQQVEIVPMWLRWTLIAVVAGLVLERLIRAYRRRK